MAYAGSAKLVKQVTELGGDVVTVARTPAVQKAGAIFLEDAGRAVKSGRVLAREVAGAWVVARGHHPTGASFA